MQGTLIDETAALDGIIDKAQFSVLVTVVVLTAVVLYQGVEKGAYEDQPPIVGVVATGSPASQSDIKRGDRIISVAGHDVDTWEQFLIAVGSRPNREVEMKMVVVLRIGLRTEHGCETRAGAAMQLAQESGFRPYGRRSGGGFLFRRWR